MGQEECSTQHMAGGQEVGAAQRQEEDSHLVRLQRSEGQQGTALYEEMTLKLSQKE
jgi:hypothetical protein